MKRSLLFVGSALMLIGMLVILNIQYAQAVGSDNTPPVDHQGQRGNWHYTARADQQEGRIDTRVQYAHTSAADIQEFSLAQQQLGAELLEADVPSINATIVFRRPLSEREFVEFVAKYNLAEISLYTIRAVDDQGQRITINGAPQHGELVPQDLLAMVLKDVNQRAKNTFRGWVDVQATIQSDMYSKLASDKDVYLVDVTRSVITETFKNDRAARNLPVQVSMHPLYWALEDLKLVDR
jgi:hypothetical protein